MDQGRSTTIGFNVDAGVCTRWLIPGEEHETQALKLRDDYAQGKIEVYAPALLTFEVLNTLWKTFERKLINLEETRTLCTAFVKLAPKTVALNREDLENTLQIATTHHITFYDASYITTTSKTKSTLVTADKNLQRTAKNYVKTLHLKDY